MTSVFAIALVIAGIDAFRILVAQIDQVAALRGMPVASVTWMRGCSTLVAAS